LKIFSHPPGSCGKWSSEFPFAKSPYAFYRERAVVQGPWNISSSGTFEKRPGALRLLKST
jgi:hypothetical protein